MELPLDITQVKGFLASDEGEALYNAAIDVAALGPCLEIGSYCGKSTVYLGEACRQTGNIVYAVDHHRGSEEHQLGEEYHDGELFDASLQLMDTFREFRAVIRSAGLEECVVPLVSTSAVASRRWNTGLGMVFIDGGHSMEAAMTDYQCWAAHVVPGGILAIHDIFPDPADGGQAPYTIYKLAAQSGLFDELPMVNTLGLLRRR